MEYTYRCTNAYGARIQQQNLRYLNCVYVPPQTSLEYQLSDGMECRSSISDSGKRYFSSPQRPDRLWGPTCLLSNRYRRIFPRG
jgi:hypothetical protein